VPTGNDDALDNEGATAGTTLLEDVTIPTDGKTELAPVDGKAATRGGGTIATEGGTITAVVPTNSVGITELIEAGIWLDTAAVGPTVPGINGTTWG